MNKQEKDPKAEAVKLLEQDKKDRADKAWEEISATLNKYKCTIEPEMSTTTKGTSFKLHIVAV